MVRKKLTKEEKYDKYVKKYTSEHGGPDLYKIGDKYKCIVCSSEVPTLGGAKCPGCGKEIDWRKFVMA